jgi:hypothetical protein
VEPLVEKMWRKNASDRRAVPTAENGPKSRHFSAAQPTGSPNQDCYTFETFASRSRDFLGAYYYHYKRKRFSLKEETKWS